MRFKKTLMALAVFGFGMTVFIVMNDKTRDPIMPVTSLKLTVAPAAQQAFTDKVRTYAAARDMAVVETAEASGTMMVMLRAQKTHINIARYGFDAPVSVSFYRSSAWFGASDAQMQKDADDFAQVVTQTAGVSRVQ